MRGWPRAILGLLAAAALLLATLPWWLGAALVPIGRQFFDTRFGRYERIGYARFALSDVEFDHRAVRVTAVRVVADTPLLWLWRHVRDRDDVITADHWQVTVRAPAPGGPASPNGITLLRGRLDRIAGHLRQWLPRAAVTDGEVRWPAGGFKLRLADWTRGTLATRGLRWAAGEADVRVAFAGDQPVRIDATEADRDWRVQLDWTGAEATGRGWAWSQPIELRGEFGPEGWLPQAASAVAADWNVPANRAGLGAAYRALQGGGRADWQGGHFQLRLRATAEPMAAGKAPALTIDLSGEGDRRGGSVRSLRIHLPYADLDLNRPIAFGFGRHLDWAGTELRFKGDLARLPGGEARGRASGVIAAAGGAGPIPDFNFTLEAKDVAWRRVAVDTAQIQGALHWPRLAVSQLELHVPGGEASGSGTWNLDTRTLADGRLRGTLPGAALSPWMPAKLSLAKVVFAATASGPLTNLTHGGDVAISGLRAGTWRPADLNGAWSGHGAAIDRGTVHLVMGATTVDASGARDGPGVRLDDLRFSPAGGEVWHLVQPARISWTPVLRIAGLRLEGAQSALTLDVAGGPDASIDVTARELRSPWLHDLVTLPGPDWVVNSLRLSGHVQNDRLIFGASAEADVSVPGHLAHVSFALDGDSNRVKLSDGKLMADGHLLAQAEGEAPIWWSAAGPSHLGFNPDGALSLSIDTTPSGPFWSALAATFGPELTEPRAVVHLHGTLRHPQGQIDLSVARLASNRPPAPAVPGLEGVSLEIRADADEIVLDHLTGRIAGQPLQAEARLPMNGPRWRQLWQRHALDGWEDAEGKLDIADADLAPLARYFPAYFAARGRWSVHAALAGGRLTGDLRVRDAATRPLPGLGRVQSIDADVHWQGRTAELTALTAQIGGQPIHAAGQADFSTWSAPRFDFTLHGDDLPLVRRPGLLVRADLDLRAATNPSGATRIAGAITVRDAIQLGDLADLLPNGTAGANSAPPYFSVDVAPFNRWQLAVDAKADGTLRIRTSIFSGSASANFRLTGTLGDPRAVGQITLQHGQISLPFAAFDVQSGAVRLTADDPFHPQIDLSATSRRYDYDLRMEVSGSAFAPTVNFTSNPALPSDQVVLLVTTGQVPSAGTAYGNSSAQVAGLGAFVGQNLFQGLGSAGSDRLDVTAGQELSLKGRPTYELDYKLRDRWWLVGEYDEFDEYIGGVKWRVYAGRAAHDAH
jgi:translocation and assembly module TamB